MSFPDPAAEIVRAGIAAADAEAAVRRALRWEDDALVAGDDRIPRASFGRVTLLAAGKAAAPMAGAAADVLGDALAEGLLVTKDGHAGGEIPRVEAWEAAHPVPDVRGLAAAAGALRRARGLGEGDLLLCLLSGGASALWPAPPDGVTLGDLRATTDALLRAGAPIAGVNAVRKHLSRLAGGRLAAAAHPARTVTLVVRDVIGGGVDAVASGPTVADPTTFADALRTIEDRGVPVPVAVLHHLRAGAAGLVEETPKPGDARLARATAHTIADVRDALEGARARAAALGYAASVVRADLEGEARDAAREIVADALEARRLARETGTPVARLWGGETTVTVRGDGRGGRCQELALAAAVALAGEAGIVLCAAGTDGTDGPTDAAGATVDGGTVARIAAAGGDAAAALARNDAHRALEAAGALLRTGPTGTNVNDLVVVLAAAG